MGLAGFSGVCWVAATAAVAEIAAAVTAGPATATPSAAWSVGFSTVPLN